MIRMLARWIGAVLALAGVAFIGWRFAQAGVWQQVMGSTYAGRLLGLCLIAMCVYLVGLGAMGIAWWRVQSAYMQQRPPLRPFFAVYATTQFAKYLPGNVGHFVGRHVLLRRYGVEHAALVMGTLTEAGFLVLAALVWAASDLRVLLPRIAIGITPLEVLAIEVVALFVVIFVLQACRKRNARLAALVPLHAPTRLFAVLPLHLFLFATMAATLMLPAQAFPISADALWMLPAAAATSWIAGFLVIGAPAGIGVREAVFVAVLQGHLPESDILLLAAAFRIATFGGDVLFLLVGLLLGGRRYDNEAQPAALNESG